MVEAKAKLCCPECGSERLYKDGLRYLKEGCTVQRRLCRNCGYRFSEPKVSLNVSMKLRKTLNSGPNLLDGSVVNCDFSVQERSDDLTLPFSEDVASHKLTVIGKPLNSFPSYNSKRQVCAQKDAKNLATSKTAQKQAAGATKLDVETVKGKTVEFLWYLKKQGYAKDVVEHRFEAIKRLISLGADLWNPESIKETLAKQTDWKDGYKLQMVYSYENFLAMEGLTWQRPRYKQKSRLPFIPTEQEIDQLIAGVGKKLGTFLQGLKDTGVDPGELMKLRWIDINIETRKVSITPVKGHDPRVLKVSREFLRRLETLPRQSEYIFTNQDSMTCNFWGTRRRLARKLNNPRLKAITFTTLRHWKGTMEYHRTRSLMHVKAFLGHKNIQNTIIYVHLEALLFDEGNDEFHVTVAKNVKEASNLVKVGFQYVTGEYDDGGKIFRKRK